MAIEKKQETNGIIISCFFVWQFMVHSMVCMSGQPGISFFFNGPHPIFCDHTFEQGFWRDHFWTTATFFHRFSILFTGLVIWESTHYIPLSECVLTCLNLAIKALKLAKMELDSKNNGFRNKINTNFEIK